MKQNAREKTNASWLRYAGAVAGVALVIAVLEPFRAHINATTVAFALLLVILLAATFIGRNPALLSSLVAVLGLNYFFLPPVRAWTISEPQNLVAWASFTVTAIIAGELSAYAKRRAEEATRRKQEIERLYRELQEAFERASEAEALRRSEKLKSALLDAVTHDLRTPLTSIKTSITTLLDDEKPDEGKFQLGTEGRHEFFEIINEETDRLNHFIEGMVELARIEAGELNLRRTLSEAGEIIQAALIRAEPLLENYQIKIDVEKDLPLLRADSKALAEVLYNLLENASKYAPENTNIEISVKRSANEMLEFTVSDEGAGIPENLREHIFDKFFRVSNVSRENRAPSGTGLGLAIAKGIIEAHNGKIRVADALQGTGTRFIFTVPIGVEQKFAEPNGKISRD
ncbi:MAG TPA: ATP-binding protein [Pyrinomonadaceae bacterium]|jgi:two-component system sensor histidine kinase KdpD